MSEKLELHQDAEADVAVGMAVPEPAHGGEPTVDAAAHDHAVIGLVGVFAPLPGVGQAEIGQMRLSMLLAEQIEQVSEEVPLLGRTEARALLREATQLGQAQKRSLAAVVIIRGD